jgi:hypothetical protein
MKESCLYRSKWHKWTRAIRVARRLSMLHPDPGDTVNVRNWRRYNWLCDVGYRMVPHSALPPLAVQCVRVRGYLAMRSMGWRDVRA